MHIDFNTPIMGLDGKPVAESVQSELEDGVRHTITQELTLGRCAVNALFSPLPGDNDMGGAKKLELYLLAQRIHANAEDADYTVEEVALLKDRIGKAYLPQASGPCWLLLEGKEVPCV